MRQWFTPLCLAIMIPSAPAWADNIAGCEIVLKETIQDDTIEGTAEVASFRPAGDFIESVYDDEIELIRAVNAVPIRAVMCKRHNIVPSMRDYPIAATGIPFILSQNFDTDASGLLTVFFKQGKFRYSYNGPDLTDATVEEIDLVIDGYNLQSNDLAEREMAMKESQIDTVSEDDMADESGDVSIPSNNDNGDGVK